MGNSRSSFVQSNQGSRQKSRESARGGALDFLKGQESKKSMLTQSAKRSILASPRLFGKSPDEAGSLKVPKLRKNSIVTLENSSIQEVVSIELNQPEMFERSGKLLPPKRTKK